MKVQDKQGEIDLSRGEFRQGSWEDSELQRQARRKQLEPLMSILPTPAQGQLVLDAGCGPGTYGIILAQRGNKVVGVDISCEATIVARERASKENVRFTPIVGDLERIPFKDDSFDICFCGYVLHHFPDINTVMTELARVLKPGGKLVLAEPNGSNPVVRLSSAVKNLFRGWLVRSTLDTPNEVIHKIRTYTQALVEQGFAGARIISCTPGGLPPVPQTENAGLGSASLNLIRTLVHLRRLIFMVADKMFPRPLNGSDLFIIGVKPRLD